MDNYYKSLLDNNKKWVESKLALDPEYFEKLAKGQQPPLLWIGCADSRVPANEIIVCGHYNCGGVQAAMGNKSYGIIDNWIRHIKNTYRLHKKELDAIEDESKRFDRYVELNVSEQVFDLAKTSIVQNAWKNNQDLMLHGWVYSIKKGIIQEVVSRVANNSKLDEVYQLDF